MDKRIRYLLIIAGFIFFLVAAPLIVLFSRGLKYDFEENKFVPTGILSVKTDPTEVEVRLDGKLIETSSGEIRFLAAKDYQINVSKPEFFDWNKTLKIESGRVTRASAWSDKIYLLRQGQNPELVQTGVLDFWSWAHGSLALLENELLLSGSWGLIEPKKIILPKKVSKILASPDSRLFLLTEEADVALPARALLFDSRTETFFDLKSLFESQKKLPAFSFSRSGRLFGLEDGALYEFNAQDSSRQMLMSKIINFGIFDETLYYLTRTNNGSELGNLDLKTGIRQTLASKLPNFSEAEIFISNQKRISLAADGALYVISTQGLTLVSGNIKKIALEKPEDPLVFLTSGELRFLDEQSAGQLITRLSEDISMPKILQPIGYAIFEKNGSLTALELDQTGGQNSYPVYFGKKIQKYTADQAGKNLLILDGQDLKQLRLR